MYMVEALLVLNGILLRMFPSLSGISCARQGMTSRCGPPSHGACRDPGGGSRRSQLLMPGDVAQPLETSPAPGESCRGSPYGSSVPWQLIFRKIKEFVNVITINAKPTSMLHYK